MSGETSQEFFKLLELRDDQVFRLGDVIDVKASIGLVIVTFLATQTATFLDAGKLPASWQFAQGVSAFALILAGVLALWELWPRDYEVETSEAIEGWAAELCDYYKDDHDAEAKVSQALAAGRLQRIKERIQVNSAMNERKSRLLVWSFRCTCLSVILNLTTLLGIALG